MRTHRRTAEQAGFSGTGAIDASGFQRGQASHHYRKRTDYSFQAMKTTLLVDTESLSVMDVHLISERVFSMLKADDSEICTRERGTDSFENDSEMHCI